MEIPLGDMEKALDMELEAVGQSVTQCREVLGIPDKAARMWMKRQADFLQLFSHFRVSMAKRSWPNFIFLIKSLRIHLDHPLVGSFVYIRV